MVQAGAAPVRVRLRADVRLRQRRRRGVKIPETWVGSLATIPCGKSKRATCLPPVAKLAWRGFWPRDVNASALRYGSRAAHPGIEPPPEGFPNHDGVHQGGSAPPSPQAVDNAAHGTWRSGCLHRPDWGSCFCWIDKPTTASVGQHGRLAGRKIRGREPEYTCAIWHSPPPGSCAPRSARCVYVRCDKDDQPVTMYRWQTCSACGMATGRRRSFRPPRSITAKRAREAAETAALERADTAVALVALADRTVTYPLQSHRHAVAS